MASRDPSADEPDSPIGNDIEPEPGFLDLLRQRGIREPWVLEAMAGVARERFVDPGLVEDAYRDRPLPIGQGQTISQPFIVALMAQAAELQPTDRVLEVGTGSGYGAAILGRRARSVVTVERLEPLAAVAADRLAAQAMDNIDVVVGDGTLGWPSGAPYDAIVVTAAGPRVPQALLDQLADGGRLVLPVGRRSSQRLLRITRHGDRFEQEDLGGVRFVPLIGVHGRGR